MRRSEVVLTLCLATVLGIIAGLVLFTQTGPFPLLAPGKAGNPPGHSSSTGTPSADDSPSPSPADASASTPSPSDPAFTKLALLQPDNFDKYNWKDTAVLNTWDGPPTEQITSCTGLRSGDGRLLAAYGSTYSGRVTTAAELVMRFSSEKAAQGAMKKLSRRIAKCQDEPNSESSLIAQAISAPQADSSVEVQIWQTSGRDDLARGVVGLARAGDRLAFLTLRSPKPGSSDMVDPRETTYIDDLYVYAGRRLI